MIYKKLIIVLFMILIFTAGCSNKVKEDFIQVNQIYMEIYNQTGQIQTLDEVQKVIENLGKQGYVAVDSNNQINMTQIEKLLEFCEKVNAKDVGQINLYVISYYDGYTEYKCVTEKGNVNIDKKYYEVIDGDLKETYALEYKAHEWKYTEEGYLFFEKYQMPGFDGASGHIALRVQPLDEKCRELNRKYILPIGYRENNMFLCDWNEEDFGKINFYDMFDVLYPMVYEERVPYDAASNYEDALVYMIPEAEFEQVIMSYFKIDSKTLQNSTRYNKEKRCYEYRPRGLYDWESPETPFPEVVDYIENEDGTISLMVNVVYPEMNVSKMFAHEVVVRPLENGKVQYVSNHIIPSDDNYRAIWHEERLDDEMWKKIYGENVTIIEKIEGGEEIE